ncbi:unnamed protein product [Brachionus calyciflorus]|uniref:Uncharacterized protein n=1 Tax=Brachionus calyciflorus TaxID=104777 RepID=A0A814KK38_9BILA|nr:unnamed protein product [Brachionus calyciflorus]
MKLENNTLFSKSTHQTTPIRNSPKLKKGSESNNSDETINIDPYLLSIKLKKAIPSIDKDISDLNETICHLIYSNKSLAKEHARRHGKKLSSKPPIVVTGLEKEKVNFSDEDKNLDNSSYENNLKSPSTNKVFEMSRLSREAKFHLEKKRSELAEKSVTRMSRDRSKSRKHRAQSTGMVPNLLEPNLNIHFHQNKISDLAYKRGISVHSRTRGTSNLRAASKANLTGSRHKIHIEQPMHDMMPDFPIPLPDESSEFLVLPPKHFYQCPPIEQINYEVPKVKHSHHKHNYSSNHQQQYYQPPPPPPQNDHQQYYPQQPMSQQIPQQMTQQIQSQPIPPQVPHQIHQQVPQQQYQIEFSPQQAHQFLNSTPAQQAEMINQIQQQVLASHQLPSQTEVVTQIQQPQQNVGAITPSQQLEMTLQKLQSLYINNNQPNKMDILSQFQQQNPQQQDLSTQQQIQQYLALKSQGQQQADLINAQQQQQQQQIQNILNFQQQQQQNIALFNQTQPKQFYNQMQQEIQLAQQQQQQHQQQQQQQQQGQYFVQPQQNYVDAQTAALKSSKMNMNFLGMGYDQQNQVAYH